MGGFSSGTRSGHTVEWRFHDHRNTQPELVMEKPYDTLHIGCAVLSYVVLRYTSSSNSLFVCAGLCRASLLVDWSRLNIISELSEAANGTVHPYRLHFMH